MARGETKRASQRPCYEINLRAINTNTNPRNPLSASLQSQGWDCMTGEKQVWKLAVSDKADERAQFVKLIQDFDPEICSLAATILSQGLLEPIEVREGGTGTFTLGFGARRCLATLFNWCLLGKPKEPIIQAFLTKGNATTMLHRAVIENIRKPQSVIDEAKAIQIALNNGETEKDIAEQLGMSASTIRNRLALLQLEPKAQKKIHEGGSVKAAKKEHAAKNGKPVEEKTPMRKRKEIETAMEEYAAHTKERAALEWVLGLREKIK